MVDRLVRTVGEMLRVVESAMCEILSEDELGATSIRVTRETALDPITRLEDVSALDAEDELDDDTLLQFTVFDERGGSWMQGRETAADMHRRFRSELQDFVAESRFGWGQLRR